MRIGIVTQSYYPVRGGIPEIVYHTTVELEKLGHEVTVITTNFSPFDEDRNTNVIRIGHDVTLPLNGAFVNITLGFKLRDTLRRIEHERRFDIVHIQQPLDLFLPITALDAFRCPKVGTFHTYMRARMDYELGERYFRRHWRRLDGRIAVSRAAHDFISRYFPGEYTIIPNGVDIGRFRPDLPKVGTFDDGAENILFVGRMDPRKGLRYLLKAFPSIADRFPRARLIVVGNGLLRPWYQMAVPVAYRSRVFYEGFVSSAMLPRYYATADVYCSPATGGESFGVVLLEAMASGVPIVASRIPGYRDVVQDGNEGRLVPPKNPQAIADTVIALLQNTAERKRMGERGRESAKNYAWDKVAKRVEEVYRRTLAKKQKKASS